MVLAKPAVAGSVPHTGQTKRCHKTKAWHSWSQEREKTNQQTGLAGQRELPLQRIQFKPAETTGEVLDPMAVVLMVPYTEQCR